MTSDELAATVAALEARVAALEAAAARAGGRAGPHDVTDTASGTADSGADGEADGRRTVDLAWPADRIELDRGDGGSGRPAAPVDGGEIGYQGSVRLHGQIEWAVRYAASSATELSAGPASGVLAALGHPIRVALAQRLLLGPASTTELQEAGGLSSTGQLYHHVRSLIAAGVAEQDGRGAYRIAPRAVVPVLVLLVAASDVARAIATTSTSG